MVGRFYWLMYLCHVSCMVCVATVVGLGSFVGSWDAGWVSVVARADRATSNLGWGRGLSPVCSFACAALAFSICICFCSHVVVCDSSILDQSLSPSSHRGAKCFRSLSEYRRGWHRVRSSLAYYFVCSFLVMCFRRVALIMSTSSEAARMVFAIWFSVCMLLMCSNSAPGISLIYVNTRRVGSLACVASCASFGQWWYVIAIFLCDRRLCTLYPWVC